MDNKTAWQPDFSREDVETVKRLGDYYRGHLTEEVMPFWESRTRDERGGYITCFNRAGEVTDTDKYIWFQGRNLWMFSALYNHVERRELWLDLARWGRDFLVKHAYAGGGRWYYRLDRAGGVKEGTISIHTDHYLLEGLCEYATASGSGEDGRLIEETYAALERNVRDMECRDLYHAVWDPVLKPHSVPLMAMGTIGVAAQTLGYDRIRPLQDYCIEQILWVFAKDEYEVLFESVARDGGVRFEGEGLVFSPGHAMESAWFVVRVGLRRGDGAMVNRALKITDWAYQKGFDKEYGGVYGAVSALGGEP
ncbi:MAG: AGE family epimerase/isomerase, partial [Synergistaceae bacterium]|nr:AGE family epimerase/isomerase [Synergistaceae bacterium]